MGLWINRLINVVLVLAILLLLAMLILTTYFQQRAAVVLTGSMTPALPRGALAFTIPIEPGKVKVGDIIAFSSKQDPDTTTSHRVVEVVINEGEISFRTKGDANEEADPWLVPADYVQGKVVFHIPYLGRIADQALLYVRTMPGLIILVILPSLVIVVGAARGMYLKRNRRQRRLELLRSRRRRWRS
jgi:signal peptidase